LARTGVNAPLNALFWRNQGRPGRHIQGLSALEDSNQRPNTEYSSDALFPRSRALFRAAAPPSSRLRIQRGRPMAFPVFVPWLLAALMPALTRSQLAFQISLHHVVTRAGDTSAVPRILR
jgi:hypothetical protein